MRSFIKWQKTVEAATKDIEGFEVLDKEHFKLFLLWGSVYKKALKRWTALYPCVYRPDVLFENKHDYKKLQHEWVHLKDAETLFGKLPKKTKRLNLILFSLAYLFPQCLAIFSLLAFVNLWWLLCLLFLLPIPAPFRAMAELRAYRRNVELGRPPEDIVPAFCRFGYYFMLPFKKKVLKELTKPSPYKELMDKAIE